MVARVRVAGGDGGGHRWGPVEGWREQVRAGRHLLLTEDLVALLRDAGWGGRKSCHERRGGGGVAGAEEVGVG